jgi:transcriptional regulator with XRE-family HTH domain
MGNYRRTPAVREEFISLPFPKFIQRMGVKLRLRRMALDMSQKDVSIVSGISTSYISDIENGVHHGISIRTLRALTDTLGLPMSELFIRVETGISTKVE